MLTNILLAIGAYYFLTKKSTKYRNNSNFYWFLRNLQYKIKRF